MADRFNPGKAKKYFSAKFLKHHVYVGSAGAKKRAEEVFQRRGKSVSTVLCLTMRELVQLAGEIHAQQEAFGKSPRKAVQDRARLRLLVPWRRAIEGEAARDAEHQPVRVRREAAGGPVRHGALRGLTLHRGRSRAAGTSSSPAAAARRGSRGWGFLCRNMEAEITPDPFYPFFCGSHCTYPRVTRSSQFFRPATKVERHFPAVPSGSDARGVSPAACVFSPTT
jgi:hypothetical protein